MAQKIPVKYENSAHDIFRPGDTVPPSFLDDTSIVAGPGIEVTRLANGTFVIKNLCFPCGGEPCVPNWENVGAPFCQGNDCVQLQQDGCGNTRTVVGSGCSPACGCVPNWTNTGAPYCSGNVCMQDQQDGCGNTRTVAGAGCEPACGACTPNYVATSTYECRADERRYRWWMDTNFCGGDNGWWEDVGPVTWTENGAQVCIGTPGTWHQPEVNQCGDTRLRDTGVACEEPCVPGAWEDVPGATRCVGTQPEQQQTNGCEYRWVNAPIVWTPASPPQTQCVGENFQQLETSQCGDSRWTTTGPVVWTPTGEEECVEGFVQVHETNQCGTSRWRVTTTPCGVIPDAELTTRTLRGMQALPGATYARAQYRIQADGLVRSDNVAGTPTTLETWLVSGVNSDFEVRATHVSGDVPAGPLNTWEDLTTDCVWTNDVTSSAPIESTSVITVEIRRKSDNVVLTTATITLIAELAV